MTLQMLKEGVMAIVFISILAAAGAIALDGFQDNLTADSFADNITDNGLEGLDNSTSYMSTIGVLLGVGALISIVVGAFYFAAR